jgi:hypothetical protein
VQTVDFDSAIRRFDPSHTSQPLWRSAEFAGKCENEPEMPAFRKFDSSPDSQIDDFGAPNPESLRSLDRQRLGAITTVAR